MGKISIIIIWEKIQKSEVFFLRSRWIKYKISNLQAALGESQLEKIDHVIMKKKYLIIIKFLNNKFFQLNNLKKTQLPHTDDYIKYKKFKIKENFKERLIKFCLKKYSFKTLLLSLSSMPMYKSSKISNQIAYKLSSNSVNLPSGYNLKLKDIMRVCNAIYCFLKKEKIRL